MQFYVVVSQVVVSPVKMEQTDSTDLRSSPPLLRPTKAQQGRFTQTISCYASLYHKLQYHDRPQKDTKYVADNDAYGIFTKLWFQTRIQTYKIINCALHSTKRLQCNS